MSLSLRAVEPVSPDEWDAFVHGCREGLVFHRNAWLEILSETQESRLKRYGFVSSADPDVLLGVMPVFIKRLGPFRVAGSPLVVEDTPYMGPALPREHVAHALVATRDTLKREASFLRVLLPHAVSDTDRDILESAGFTVTTKHTHRLDLSIGTDAIWTQMEGRCRTAIRRAEKEGVEVRRVTDSDSPDVSRYYSLAQQVYGHQGRSTPNPFTFYEAIWQRFAPTGLLSLMMASVAGKDVAGGLFAHDDREVYYLDGASDRDHRNFNAGNLVLWRALQWGADNGRSVFDFVGSDIPRLARFKASFGGRQEEHSCIEWARSKSVWMARAWYAERGKQLLSRMRSGLRRPGGESD